jgi:hypothetical protein
MESDKQLKELLEKGTEKASLNFTAGVMAGVHARAAKPFVYEPLVSPLVRRIFMIAFIAVLALIFISCLLIIISGMSFTWSVKMPDISAETYQKIITGILIFWIVFAINKLVTRSWLKLVNGE